ncbi:MAG TPA: hypothetical protein DDZ81_17990 [Acetobacteraceae bacterium]|jgi:hypothetical protein|nr:hypothetical protein [Acetobacteraceae bacterium]
MALIPIDQAHALQIQAGTLGRRAGHAFEDDIASRINSYTYPIWVNDTGNQHLGIGDPAFLLISYIARVLRSSMIVSATAISTGALATSEEGQKWLSINGASVRRCKSDLVVTISLSDGRTQTVGISTKQCNNTVPTNAQLYFTTARGFTKLLRDHGIYVSDEALTGLRRFCGDAGFRPLDFPNELEGRSIDPRRYFWEEMSQPAQQEWAHILTNYQDAVTRLLLQKAYIDDLFVPDFLIHKTRASSLWGDTEVAIYAIEELVRLSRMYQKFATREYSVRKGSYRDPQGYSHLAPRFGIVQMQRGGQEQHPEQLQFNLEAGYFYKIENLGG